MTLIAINRADLMALVHQVRSGIIHADVTSKELERLVTSAKPAVDLALAERLAEELRRGHCRNCKPLGFWPVFEKVAKVTKCKRCRVLEEFEYAKVKK